MLSVAAFPEGGIARAPGGSLPWLLTLLSMALLPLDAKLGSSSVGIFLMLWLGYAVAWPTHAVVALRRQTLLWLFPAVALLSTLWSIAPDESLRHGLQLCLTTAIAILMARSITKADFLAALLCSLLPQILLGMVAGGRQVTETGALAAIGFFASKNMFAQDISLMLFASVGVLANRNQPAVLRAAAVVGLVSTPFLLFSARSIGALVTAGPCVLVMLILLSLTALPRRYRPLAIFCSVTALCIIGLLVVAAVLAEREAILGLLGKGSGLTGRDILWYRADFLISQHPTLGVGYQAFWIQGNLDAEGLWRAEHIPGRSGFHFHSFFYETVIELGYVGFALVTTQFLIIVGTIIVWGLREPSTESAFFCAVAVFYLLRSPVEVDFIAPFGLTPLLLPAGWLYARMARGH